MKATTTKKNSAKRTLAGILATIALATAAVPTAVQAGIMVPGITASAYLSPKSENRDAIDKYFKELKYDEESVLNSNAESDQQTKDFLVRGANGNYRIVHQERAKDEETFDTFSVMNAASNVIYPGSLLVADRYLLAGNPTPIDLPRNDLTISIANANTAVGKGVSTVVNPTNASDVYDGIKRLRDDFAQGTDFPAQISARIEKVESSDQIKAKLHLSQKVWGEMNLDAEAVNTNKKQACMVDISQVFYTVTTNKCKGADLFADDVTVEDVMYEIDDDNPAVMVSSVDYGRKIIACIQTDDTSFDLKASLEASGLGGKISGKAEAEYDTRLSKCSVNVFILGGSSQKGGQFLKMSIEDLLKAAGETTGYDGYAMPINYTTRFAKTGRIAQSNYLGDKWITVISEERTEKPFNITTNKIDGEKIKSINVKVYGKKIIGINEFNRFIQSEEMLLDDITLDHNTSTEAKGILGGDVLLDTVKFVFTYEGNGEYGELENGGVINLHDANGECHSVGWVSDKNGKFKYALKGYTINDIDKIEFSIGCALDDSDYRHPVSRLGVAAFVFRNYELAEKDKDGNTVYESVCPRAKTIFFGNSEQNDNQTYDGICAPAINDGLSKK